MRRIHYYIPFFIPVQLCIHDFDDYLVLMRCPSPQTAYPTVNYNNRVKDTIHGDRPFVIIERNGGTPVSVTDHELIICRQQINI